MRDSLSKVLVHGANSAQGIPVVNLLLKEGYAVRVFVRNRDKAQVLFSERVEIHTGSLEDQDSLKQANEGIDQVFLILPLEYRFDVAITQGYNAIDAARNAGVKLLVFNTSTSIPKQTTDVNAFEIKRKVEQYLRESGVPYIILRPTIYMDNLAAPWSMPGIVHQNTIAYPLPPDIRISWISLNDAAAFAVAALERSELAGSTFDIGGPEAVNGKEIAELFTKALNCPFIYQQIPIDGFEQGLNQAFGKPTGTEIAKIYRWRVAHPEDGAVDVGTVLHKLPVNLTAFNQWIQDFEWTGNSV
jgi:NAD(P)H dehydrogenase (quinone)